VIRLREYVSGGQAWNRFQARGLTRVKMGVRRTGVPGHAGESGAGSPQSKPACQVPAGERGPHSRAF